MSTLPEYYFEEAERKLAQAEGACKSEKPAATVAEAQEAVEYASKALLEALGLSYPLAHDVSDVLLLLTKKRSVPSWLRRDLPKMAGIVKALALKRIAARYGDQRKGQPPSALFTQEEAESALKEARFIVEHTQRLLRASR